MARASFSAGRKRGTGTAARPLSGRHAVVTGGGRGIGAAVAEALAVHGADVTLIGRDPGTLEATRGRIAGAYGVDACAAVADVSDAAAVKEAFAASREALGKPDILINNAGAAGSAPFARTGRELWDSMLAVNLTGTWLATQEAVPAMVEAGWGRVVNLASTAGLTGYRYVTAYCAAKHGVVGLTRALALELARTGVTVNAVCPGFTDTDLIADSVRTIAEKSGCTEQEAREQLAQINPQGRLVEPAEVASAVAWLCLPDQAAMTGQAIAVAGGEVMS